MDQERPVITIVEYFSELEDPQLHNRRHKLLDIVVLAICGVICNAEGWEDIELFGETKRVTGLFGATDIWPRIRCWASGH